MKEINTLSGGASLSTPPNIGYINQMMYRMGQPSFSSQQQKVLPDVKSVEIAVAMRPFTDSQQVQLRAQIIVYGALLKGLLPDEVLMVAAFADLNAGRQGADTVKVKKHEWEKSWYVAAERLKSSLATVSTAPSLPFTVAKPSSAVVTTTIAADDRNLHSSPPGIRDISGSKGPSCQPMQNIGITTATNTNANTNANTNTNKSMSPALSLPTQAMVPPSLSSDYSFSMKFSKSAQTDHSQMLKCSGISHGPPLVTTSFPIQQWTPAVRTEAFRPPVSYSTFRTVAGQDLTQQYALPPSTNFAMPLPVQESTYIVLRDEQKPKSSHGQLSVSEPRSRKKMKSLTDLPVDIHTTESSLTSTTPITRASVVSDAIKVNTQGVSLYDAVISTSISPLPVLEVVDRAEKTSQSITVLDSIISDPLVSVVKETPLPLGKISDQLDQAKLSAEEAMLSAVSAVKHSEKIWNQFKARKHSGLISGKEANPTSSLAITEAAALVAKAAAAAARLAYEAALQSSIAEEVSAPCNIQSFEPASSGLAEDNYASSENALLQLADSSALSTWQMPTNCKTIIDSATEAAKKRLDFVSAAKKRAENVIAIVRAAELAAAAVSHIQTVVALGDSVSARADKLSNLETAELPLNNTEKELPIQSGIGNIGQGNGEIPSPCADCRKQDQSQEILSSGEACFQDAIRSGELPVEKANVPESLRQNETKKVDRSQNVLDGIGMIDAVVTSKNAGKSLVTSGLEIEERSAAETETPAPKRAKRDTRLNEKRLLLSTEESQPRENYTDLGDDQGSRESKVSQMKIGVPKRTGKHTFLDVNKSPTFKRAGGRRIPEESEITTPSSPQLKPKTSKTTAKFVPEAKPRQEDMFERILSKDGKFNPSADFHIAQKSNVKSKKWNAVDQSQCEQHKPAHMSQDSHHFDAQISDSKRKKKKEMRKMTASKNHTISAESRPSSAETENKRDSGNISAELIEPRRRSSRVSQPTSKLLEGLETTPTLGRSLHLQ